MLSIPKLSAPLTKAIRTSEGILVFATNAGLVVGASVDPTKLPPKEAALFAVILNGLHLASRTLLKVVSVQNGLGVGQPLVPGAAAKTGIDKAPGGSTPVAVAAPANDPAPETPIAEELPAPVAGVSAAGVETAPDQ